MMRIKVLFLLLLLFVSESWAQDRYMVFFRDKDQTPFNLTEPLAFLSQRALDRRTQNGISLDPRDLPVDPSYVTTISALGIETYFTTKWMNGVLVQMHDALLSEVGALPFVSHVEYVAPGILLSDSPSDQRSTRTVGTNSLAESPTEVQNKMLDIDQMHRGEIKGAEVMIAVFDDGFSNFRQIPAFQPMIANGQVVYVKDFTTNANIVERAGTHGTRVLSVLAADDGFYQGVAPEAKYFLAVTEAAGEYRVEEYNWLFAAEQADSAGVDIINSSLGYSIFDDKSMSYTTDDMDGQTAIVSQAAQAAIDKGIVVVNSAGNTGNGAWNTVVAPADVPEVLSIGAIQSNGTLAFFSSTGPNALGIQKPELVALGSGTAVIDSDGLYKFQNGTSFSAPLVAGLAAGLLSAYPDLTVDDLFDLLIRSADRFESPSDELGYGLPNWSSAIALMEDPKPQESFDFRIYPNPTGDGQVSLAIDPKWMTDPLAIMIIDGQGVEVIHETWEATRPQLELDLSALQKGLYLIRLTSMHGIATQKLLIQ